MIIDGCSRVEVYESTEPEMANQHIFVFHSVAGEDITMCLNDERKREMLEQEDEYREVCEKNIRLQKQVNDMRAELNGANITISRLRSAIAAANGTELQTLYEQNGVEFITVEREPVYVIDEGA